jgi:hypothetical protein
VNPKPGGREFGIELVKRLLILLAFPVLLGGCGVVADRDLRAYNTCLARHPAETVVCEGPRQAYRVDPSDLPASAAVPAPPAGTDTNRPRL